jgi:hypothetical protein
LAVEYFVDKPSESKEQNLSNKEDIVNAFLFSKRSWCKMSKNFLKEDQILHDAAKVLRGSIHAVEISKDLYPSPFDLSRHRSLQFIPPSLMTFLSWLVDDSKTVSLQCKKHKYQMHEGFQLNV